MPHRLFATHRRTVATAVVCALLMFGSIGLTSYSFINGHNQSCARSDNRGDVLYDVLKLSEPTKDEIAAMPLKQQRRVNRFYRRAYARIAASRC